MSPSLSLLLLALPTAITAVTLDCSHIRIDKQSFDLSPLSGPKTVHRLQYEPPSIDNTTFTLDICNRLSPDSKIPKSERCPGGTQVCGVRTGYRVGGDGKGNLERVIPIAGEFSASHGRGLDPYVTRLKGSASHEDSKMEGLRIELHGGRYPETKEGKDQKAIIEFLCDPEVEGTEGFEKEKDAKVRRADEKEDDGDGEDEVVLPDLDKGKMLQFVSYKDEKPEGKDEMGVLRLNWKTKYACEGAADKAPTSPGKKAASWGFFTWFLIMYVLSLLRTPATSHSLTDILASSS